MTMQDVMQTPSGNIYFRGGNTDEDMYAMHEGKSSPLFADVAPSPKRRQPAEVDISGLMCDDMGGANVQRPLDTDDSEEGTMALQFMHGYSIKRF